MYQHILIRAKDKNELLSGLTMGKDSIKIFNTDAFTTRSAAIDYLQHRLKELNRYSAMAVPVMLPTTQEYRKNLQKTQTLIDRLFKTPETWPKVRERLEKQIVDVSSQMYHLEEREQEARELHWAIYWIEKQHEPNCSNRTQIQPSCSK